MTTIPCLKREGSERSAPSRAVQNAPRIDGESAVNNLPSEPGEALREALEALERACPVACLKQGASKGNGRNGRALPRHRSQSEARGAAVAEQ